jgi:diguanylate cyclase (GGDEF)-like protein
LFYGFAMAVSSTQMRRFFRESVALRFALDTSTEARQALARLLRIDALTGIASRRYFDEMFTQEWQRAQREDSDLSVVVADIDHFKAYNDHYGHVAGDQCLNAVAQALAATLHRPADLAARFGGEEFAVLLPDTPRAGAAAVAEQIRLAVLALNLPHAARVDSGKVTISLGVSCSADPGLNSARDLLRAADQALYEAKRAGRNQVAVARLRADPDASPLTVR